MDDIFKKDDISDKKDITEDTIATESAPTDLVQNDVVQDYDRGFILGLIFAKIAVHMPVTSDNALNHKMACFVADKELEALKLVKTNISERERLWNLSKNVAELYDRAENDHSGIKRI